MQHVTITHPDHPHVQVTWCHQPTGWQPALVALTVDVLTGEPGPAYLGAVAEAVDATRTLLPEQPGRRGRPLKHDLEHYREVADRYRDLRDQVRAPVSALAQHYGVSYPIASHWVSTARRLGFQA